MKLSLISIATTLCISLPVAQAAVRSDCLDDSRNNLETVCRTTCEKEDAVAFSVSYDDTDDICSCHGNIDGLGVYVGKADEEHDTQVRCYSMPNGDEETRNLGYGGCMADTINPENLGTSAKITMKVSNDENQDEYLLKACRNECAKSNSVAFSVEFSGSYEGEDDACLCYSDRASWTASGYADSKICYSMEGNGDIQMLGYGGCAIERFIKGPVATGHVMKRCQQEEPHVEKLLRGSISV